jgi:hypothetical protein
MAEIAAGRVRYDTHVLHVSHSIHSIELALATGISVDLVTPQFDPGSIWTVGGRVRGMEDLPAALAAVPPYVMVQSMALDPAELADYDVVLEEPRHRLTVYRLRALTAVGY